MNISNVTRSISLSVKPDLVNKFHPCISTQLLNNQSKSVKNMVVRERNISDSVLVAMQPNLASSNAWTQCWTVWKLPKNFLQKNAFQ